MLLQRAWLFSSKNWAGTSKIKPSTCTIWHRRTVTNALPQAGSTPWLRISPPIPHQYFILWVFHSILLADRSVYLKKHLKQHRSERMHIIIITERSLLCNSLCRGLNHPKPNRSPPKRNPELHMNTSRAEQQRIRSSPITLPQGAHSRNWLACRKNC